MHFTNCPFKTLWLKAQTDAALCEHTHSFLNSISSSWTLQVDQHSSLYHNQHVNTGSKYVPAPEAKTQPATVKEPAASHVKYLHKKQACCSDRPLQPVCFCFTGHEAKHDTWTLPAGALWGSTQTPELQTLNITETEIFPLWMNSPHNNSCTCGWLTENYERWNWSFISLKEVQYVMDDAPVGTPKCNVIRWNCSHKLCQSVSGTQRRFLLSYYKCDHDFLLRIPASSVFSWRNMNHPGHRNTFILQLTVILPSFITKWRVNQRRRDSSW